MDKEPIIGEKYRGVSLEQALSDLLDPDPKVRCLSLRFLQNRRHETILPHVVKAAKDNDGSVRSLAIQIISKFKDSSLIPLLREALEDKDECVVMQALRGLHHIGHTGLLEFEKSLKSSSPFVRRRAVTYLACNQIHEAIPIILDLLNDTDKGVRKVALWATVSLSQDIAMPHLIRALDDSHEVVRDMALRYLRRIVGPVKLEANHKILTLEREIREWKMWWQRKATVGKDNRRN
ncbi:MAG TPA: HEAT repeat domain-containing protein [Syntrophaceae bacterium]|nr:HEAT repeat domain-containing protein [Syntrophaceae bacterium]